MKNKKYAVAISFLKNNTAGMLTIHKVDFKEKDQATKKENEERAVEICLKRDSTLKLIKKGLYISSYVTIQI